MRQKYRVTIVGRPNVGKSALFNRLVGKRVAIVDDVSGITRDRIENLVKWEKKSFVLVDTGGYVPRDKDTMISKIKEQIQKAIEDASVLVFVVDVQSGINPLDTEIAEIIRKSGKKIILVGNKADNQNLRIEGQILYKLGFSDVFLVSSLHGTGVEDLLDAIVHEIEEHPDVEEDKEKDIVKLAVVGRPNVGKSTYINKVIKEERVIVDSVPGTTRDSVDIHARIMNIDWLFIDTAGIRKKKKITEAVEKYSLIRTENSIRRADVIIFMVDAIEGIARQDEQAMKFAKENGKSCIVAINKWDLIKGISKKEYEADLRHNYDVMVYLPIAFVSSLRGDNVNSLLKEVIKIYKDRKKFIKTADINQLLERAFKEHPPPIRKKKRLKLYYGTQIGSEPPKFLCFVNNSMHSDRTYENYLINTIRKAYDFEGTPIELIFKSTNIRKK